MKKSTEISVIILLMAVVPLMLGSNYGITDKDYGGFDAMILFLLTTIVLICFAFVSIILIITFDCIYKQRERHCLGYIISALFLNLPTFSFIIMKLCCIFIKTNDFYWSTFLNAIDECFQDMGIIISLSSLLTLGILLFFCRLNKKLKNPDYVY